MSLYQDAGHYILDAEGCVHPVTLKPSHDFKPGDFIYIFAQDGVTKLGPYLYVRGKNLNLAGQESQFVLLGQCDVCQTNGFRVLLILPTQDPRRFLVLFAHPECADSIVVGIQEEYLKAITAGAGELHA